MLRVLELGPDDLEQVLDGVGHLLKGLVLLVGCFDVVDVTLEINVLRGFGLDEEVGDLVIVCHF